MDEDTARLLLAVAVGLMFLMQVCIVVCLARLSRNSH